MGQRIVVLDRGVIQQVGEPLRIYEKPANLFVAGFIGSPRMNFFETRVEEGGGALALAGTRLPLPAGERDRLQGHRDSTVILGLRPEDVHLDSQGEITAQVVLVEPTGGESYIYAGMGGGKLVARALGAVRLGLGERVSFRFDLARAHFFDPRSTQRIEA